MRFDVGELLREPLFGRRWYDLRPIDNPAGQFDGSCRRSRYLRFCKGIVVIARGAGVRSLAAAAGCREQECDCKQFHLSRRC
jgi:hypothetical protein